MNRCCRADDDKENRFGQPMGHPAVAKSIAGASVGIERFIAVLFGGRSSPALRMEFAGCDKQTCCTVCPHPLYPLW
jgi:hypothetical protein